ncbi:HalOD1 output domain-containing protein [Haloarcula amylovorans]|uniref:HalOD1 output domain-containing protein n=1 Tax=Haloarcula amylovorans TaxID=2562280 RepID=UPI00107658A6|nr:HalOD1 output domain-containing protein [Halomicroarcula amylolytica]
MTANKERDDTANSTMTEPTQSMSYEIGETEPPSIAVVKAVAAMTGEDVRDLEPLYEVLNPVHLDGMFDDVDGGAHSHAEVSLQFNGCTVTVTAGSVQVQRC